MPLTVLVLGSYGVVSALLFGLYGIDKSAAQRGRMRIPEATLHTLAVLGGWPGALLGQRVMRDLRQQLADGDGSDSGHKAGGGEDVGSSDTKRGNEE